MRQEGSLGIKIIAKNRKAFHEYEITDRFEAGIALQGTEVKSMRQGKVNLGDGWISIDDQGEAYLKQVHISHYSHGNIYNHDEARPRKLLLKKQELKKLSEQVERKGFALVPLKAYFKGQFIKIEIGVGKGKKAHDKRDSSKEKDAQREIERAIKGSKY
ncbi:MAG: SsrA-binding protein SmpB [Oligoflexales bacterium]|nr:SsrA-binding protein SmpB [Oligoflexales bacterium]